MTLPKMTKDRRPSAVEVHVVRYPDRSNLVLRWREGKRQCTQSAGTANRREAERLAMELEAKLRAKQQAQAAAAWAVTRARYTAEVMPRLGKQTPRARHAALNQVERLLKPAVITDLNADSLSRFEAALRADGLSDATIAGYFGHIKPLLTWAERIGLLAAVPRFPKISLPRGKLMKGRPLTADEFQLLLAAVPSVLTLERDRQQFTHLLRGLWLSGLRLGEAKRITWVESPFCVDLSGRYPRIRMEIGSHKGKRDLLLPLADDFADFLLEVSPFNRFGAVFEVGVPDRRVGEIIAEIGASAGIEVRKGKFASAHDLRRSFGSRWAPRVKPATLQLLMRHASIETTMKYYVDLDADEVGDELRKRHGLTRAEIAEAQGLLGRGEDDEEEAKVAA